MRPEEKGRFRRGEKDRELPPALAAMLDERRAAAEAATETARSSAIVALPAAAWREIQQRAATVGVEAELVGDGGELRISVDLPTPDAEAAAGRRRAGLSPDRWRPAGCSGSGGRRRSARASSSTA